MQTRSRRAVELSAVGGRRSAVGIPLCLLTLLTYFTYFTYLLYLLTYFTYLLTYFTYLLTLLYWPANEQLGSLKKERKNEKARTTVG